MYALEVEEFPRSMACSPGSWSNNYCESGCLWGLVDLALLPWLARLSQRHQCLTRISSFCYPSKWWCSDMQLHGERPWLWPRLLCSWWHVSPPGQHLWRQFPILEVREISNSQSVKKQGGRMSSEHFDCCKLGLQLREVLLIYGTMIPRQKS